MSIEPTGTFSAQRREEYLETLGFDASPPIDTTGLQALQVAHLRTFPFENLDIHLGRPIHLDVESLLSKLLDDRRGGYCYELNGAFAVLLESLGFEVSLLEARVYDGDDIGIRFDHACLLVQLEEPRLVDVGFGASFHHPLIVQSALEQADPGGSYRIEQRSDGWLDLVENGRAQYRFSLQPRELKEFAEANLYQQTSPESHFTQNTICSLPTPTGRITVKGLQLIETTNGERSVRDLDAGQLAAVLSERFGIQLEPDDALCLAQGRRESGL